MARWLIEQGHDGEFNVLRNGRRVRVGLTEELARKYVNLQRGPKDRAQIEEPDGYRVPVRRPSVPSKR